MDVNKLLDTIQKGLREVENELLESVDARVKAQRSKPIDARVRELEMLVSRMKLDVSSIKSSVNLLEMRLESARNDAAQALAEVRVLASANKRRKRR